MKSLFSLLLLLSICFSCSKEDYEPYLKGSIVGFALLTDQYGNLLDDHSGIYVYVEPGRIYSGKTDLRGRFENLGTGTYVVEYTKQGWGATKHYSQQVYGNDVILCNQRMYKRPDFAMPALYQLDASLDFRSNLSSESSDIPYLRAFFSRTRDVSCVKYDYSYGILHLIHAKQQPFYADSLI